MSTETVEDLRAPTICGKELAEFYDVEAARPAFEQITSLPEYLKWDHCRRQYVKHPQVEIPLLLDQVSKIGETYTAELKGFTIGFSLFLRSREDSAIAFNELCRMIGGRWADAKMEEEAPKAYQFFMNLLPRS